MFKYLWWLPNCNCLHTKSHYTWLWFPKINRYYLLQKISFVRSWQERVHYFNLVLIKWLAFTNNSNNLLIDADDSYYIKHIPICLSKYHTFLFRFQMNWWQRHLNKIAIIFGWLFVVRMTISNKAARHTLIIFYLNNILILQDWIIMQRRANLT